jgi:hypothetical protein
MSLWLAAAATVLMVAGQPPAHSAAEPASPPTGAAQTATVLNPLLGKRFGEKVTITGKAPESPMMLSNPISVTAIDGKTLDKPILIEVQQAKIATGIEYTLIGYESGGFGSTPDWATRGIPAQQPFHFYQWFVVVQVVEPKAQ